MTYFIILFSFLFLAGNPQPDPNVLSVSAEGQVELPADLIQFNINLNAEAESPEGAYQSHQKLEEALVNLLKRYEIEEKNINFEPISISSSRRHIGPNEEKVFYHTRQMVSLTLDNFDNYEKLQIALVKYGFDNFHGSFMSSKEQEGKNMALRKAIQAARKKAKVIAEEAGVEVGAISSITYHEPQNRPYPVRQYAAIRAESAGQLMEYRQTITITAHIEIQFELQGTDG